jgi:hypothetical protein
MLAPPQAATETAQQHLQARVAVEAVLVMQQDLLTEQTAAMAAAMAQAVAVAVQRPMEQPLATAVMERRELSL